MQLKFIGLKDEQKDVIHTFGEEDEKKTNVQNGSHNQNNRNFSSFLFGHHRAVLHSS